MQRRKPGLHRQGIDQGRQHVDTGRARSALLAQPWWLDWTAGLFPVILMVFLLRSFLFEPFKIPSGSMIPTLRVGDLILVNKFHYGIRLPVLNTKIIANNEPAARRCDGVPLPGQSVASTTSSAWSAVPGDEVAYMNKKLYRSTASRCPRRATARLLRRGLAMRYSQAVHRETLASGASTPPAQRPQHARLRACRAPSSSFRRRPASYTAEGVVCKVPAGHYFVMGDNRDNSQDSRYWGFVPDENIVGKAFFVWMNFGNLKRIGSVQLTDSADLEKTR